MHLAIVAPSIGAIGSLLRGCHQGHWLSSVTMVITFIGVESRAQLGDLALRCLLEEIMHCIRLDELSVLLTTWFKLVLFLHRWRRSLALQRRVGALRLASAVCRSFLTVTTKLTVTLFEH